MLLRSFIIFYHLTTTRERIKFLILMKFTILVALVDVAGVASILPFIALLSNPSVVHEYQMANWFMETFSYSRDTFLFVVGLGVFLLLLFSLALKATATFIQLKLVLEFEYRFSKTLMKTYLGKPFPWFLNKNSADLGKNILSEVSTIVGGTLLPMVLVFSQSAITLGMLTLLLFIDAHLAIYVGSGLAIGYGLIYLSIKNFLSSIGEGRFRTNQERFKIVNETFGAVKAIKLSKLEDAYLSRFDLPAKLYARHQRNSQVAVSLPRYLLEAIAFGGLMGAILYMMKSHANFNSMVPTLALYAFAGYRLMPALNQVFANISLVRFTFPAINKLKDELAFPQNSCYAIGTKENLTFKHSITLKNVDYAYPGASHHAVKNVSIHIPKEKRIALVGPTGSGKSTTVDIILALLSPSNGELFIDGVLQSTKDYLRVQDLIGYVPQDIYIADDTVAKNIAFGVAEKQISLNQIKKSAKLACIDEFIEQELTEGYQTIIGERGSKLSGGQRQRIGIARALYNNPEIVILDEGTSALDSITERQVFDSLTSKHVKYTLISVAHRISSIKNCDRIFVFDNGIVTASGTYDELLISSGLFRGLAKND